MKEFDNQFRHHKFDNDDNDNQLELLSKFLSDAIDKTREETKEEIILILQNYMADTYEASDMMVNGRLLEMIHAIDKRVKEKADFEREGEGD